MPLVLKNHSLRNVGGTSLQVPPWEGGRKFIEYENYIDYLDKTIKVSWLTQTVCRTYYLENGESVNRFKLVYFLREWL